MKKLFVVITVFSIITLGFTAESFAQKGAMKWQGSGGWGPGTSYNRMYDPAKAETLSGTVGAITQVTPMKGMRSAVALTLKTDKETISVHLGPDWYISRLDTKIEKGDTIEVKGARATFFGKPAIIAGEIKKGENILVLRDSAGIPVWSGWRR
ncbi:MAG: DNA-binding protein [Proteobacteria bacterium]|nr:DNA-binding protein [Pseudomonadota bacterium]